MQLLILSKKFFFPFVDFVKFLIFVDNIKISYWEINILIINLLFLKKNSPGFDKTKQKFI